MKIGKTGFVAKEGICAMAKENEGSVTKEKAGSPAEREV